MIAAARSDLSEIERAALGLAGILVPTPLVPFAPAGAPAGILLKLEVHQVVGSFKIRGVFHAVAGMDPELRARGISTVSAGNTAQALAWCGARFGVGARCLMPETAPRAKVEKVRALGGTPVLAPAAEVFRFLRERGWEDEPYGFVHPWTSRDVMAGHGTIGLEIVREHPEVDTVFVPVGGGGLLGGVGSALRASKPGVRIVAVEPEGCPSFHASREAGRPVTVECATICDGVAVPFVAGEMFPLLDELADDSVLVPERDVRAAVRRLATEAHVVAEPAGALALAAALALPPEARGSAVCLVTGGSIDPSLLAEILVERG
jgi:threonine dehydratase